MYLRFISREQDENSRSFVGVFTHVYRIRNSEELLPHEKETLEHSLGWLKMHLKVPAVLKDEGNERAICWFKDTAKRPMEHVWQLVHLLRDHGIHMELVKTNDPGVILYEDGWQVVAKPHRKDRVKVSQG